MNKANDSNGLPNNMSIGIICDPTRNAADEAKGRTPEASLSMLEQMSGITFSEAQNLILKARSAETMLSEAEKLNIQSRIQAFQTAILNKDPAAQKALEVSVAIYSRLMNQEKSAKSPEASAASPPSLTPDAVDQLFDAGDGSGLPLIWSAAHMQQWDLVRLLLKSGANNLDSISTENTSRGATILWYAAFSGEWEIVKDLLKRGVKNIESKLETAEFKVESVLLYATLAQQWDIVETLLDRGAQDISESEKNTNYVNTIVYLALISGNKNMVQKNKIAEILCQYLPKQNLDDSLGLQDLKGLPLIWLAGSYQLWGAAEILFDRGAGNLDAKPNSGFNKGCTLLLSAGLAKKWAFFNKILNSGKAQDLEAYLRDENGNVSNLLSIAIGYKEWPTVWTLINKGASIAENNLGNGDLFLILRKTKPYYYNVYLRKQKEKNRLLAQKNANLKKKNFEGVFPGLKDLHVENMLSLSGFLDEYLKSNPKNGDKIGFLKNVLFALKSEFTDDGIIFNLETFCHKSLKEFKENNISCLTLPLAALQDILDKKLIQAGFKEGDIVKLFMERFEEFPILKSRKKESIRQEIKKNLPGRIKALAHAVESLEKTYHFNPLNAQIKFMFDAIKLQLDSSEETLVSLLSERNISSLSKKDKEKMEALKITIHEKLGGQYSEQIKEFQALNHAAENLKIKCLNTIDQLKVSVKSHIQQDNIENAQLEIELFEKELNDYKAIYKKLENMKPKLKKIELEIQVQAKKEKELEIKYSKKHKEAQELKMASPILVAEAATSEDSSASSTPPSNDTTQVEESDMLCDTTESEQESSCSRVESHYAMSSSAVNSPARASYSPGHRECSAHVTSIQALNLNTPSEALSSPLVTDLRSTAKPFTPRLALPVTPPRNVFPAAASSMALPFTPRFDQYKSESVVSFVSSTPELPLLSRSSSTGSAVEDTHQVLKFLDFDA